MSNNIIKKIIIGLSIPIFLLIISWSVWTTKNVFSAQKNEILLQEYKIDTTNKQNMITEELKSFKNSVDDRFNRLDSKIDGLNGKIQQNQKDTYDILLDIMKKINKE